MNGRKAAIRAGAGPPELASSEDVLTHPGVTLGAHVRHPRRVVAVVEEGLGKILRRIDTGVLGNGAASSTVTSAGRPENTLEFLLETALIGEGNGVPDLVDKSGLEKREATDGVAAVTRPSARY